MQTLVHRGHTFEIVDSVSGNYRIWNIGHNMAPGYVPFALLDPDSPSYPFAIDPGTLKAVPCDLAEVVKLAATYGPGNLSEMKAFLDKHGNAGPRSKYRTAVDRVRQAIPVLEKIQK